MADKPELLHVPRTGAELVISETRSSLIARAQKDAVKLMAFNLGPQPAPSAEKSLMGIVDEPDEDGDPFTVGLEYEEGDGRPQDYQRAAFWYRKASEQGDDYAQNNLGALYENGLGVVEDFEKAAFWYGKAADQGNIGGQQNLGRLYELGQGVPQDLAKAAMWYSGVAYQYEEGKGVLRDKQQAATWNRKAAVCGDPAAQLRLGLLYLKGEGVQQDDIQAAEWIAKASEHAMPLANYNLGLLYMNGRGVPRDNVRAYFWLYLSTRTTWKNPTYIEAREFVASRLTATEIAEARARADHWVAANHHIECLF